MHKVTPMTPEKHIPTLTYDEWMAEGKRRFGENFHDWKFVCPVCENVAAIGDYKQYKHMGAEANSATCECIGRYQGADGFKPLGQGPCDYALYGLFSLPGMKVELADGKVINSFAFANAGPPAS
jgi:hypothetical protein